jgi:peptide/nickel transport system substrate-binding protein
MHRRTLSLFAMFALLVSMVFAASAQDDADIIQYPITVDPEHLNPFIADTISIGTVNRNIYEGLTRYNSVTGDIDPAIAESWEVSTNADGQQVFTFNIREGVLFHDIADVDLESRAVTASDILWNYKVALHPDQDISLQSGNPNFQAIAGATEYTAALQAMIDEGAEEVPLVLDDMDIPGLQVLDESTFQITLEAPNRLFLINGMVSITSPEAYTELGDDFNDTPVGTGPYQFVEWLREDRVILEANPDYYIEGLPRNDGIRFTNYGDAQTVLLDYREDNVDFLFAFPSGQRAAIIDEFSAEFNEKPGLHQRYWGFNMETGFLAENPLVRQALAHSLDRSTAWDIFEEGARFPADQGFLPPSMPASEPSVIYNYDLERAAELLQEAGFPNGEGLPVMEIHLLEVISDEAQVVVWQEALTELGMEVEFIIEDGSTYWDSIVEDDAMIFQNGWAAGLVDPSDVFDYLIYQGEGSMRYDNAAVNELLDQARAELDPATREDLYQQAHNIIMEDAVVIPSAYSKVSWLQKPWIEGFEPGGGGTYTAALWNVELNR